MSAACGVCARIEMCKRGENPYLVRELETGYAVIGDHQRFHGYTLFLCKRHESELYRLPDDFKRRFLEEMSLVAEAADRAFHPDKMNYELLGNGLGHMHWHLFPRWEGDTAQPGPVWWTPYEEMSAESARPSPEELETLKRQLGDALDAVLKEHGKA